MLFMVMNTWIDLRMNNCVLVNKVWRLQYNHWLIELRREHLKHITHMILLMSIFKMNETIIMRSSKN